MAQYQATGIQLHLTTGNKRMFYQENIEFVAKICSDLEGNVFSRASLVLECADDILSFPGTALIGITILTDPLPDAFYQVEKLTKTVIKQISEESFQFRRLQGIAKIEGQRSPSLSELEFVSGERLFLEFSEIAQNGMHERNGLHHLFTRPALSCRRLDGGFSIWNTAHIVSWSHYPKIEVPMNAWQVESISEHVHGDAKLVGLL